MNFKAGVCTSLFVLTASIPLTAATNPQQTSSGAPAAETPAAGASSQSSPPASSAAASGENPDLPSWAFTPIGPPRPAGSPRPEDDPTVYHVPGSTVGFTKKEVMNLFGPPDWFPDSHPPMPPTVAHGRKPEPAACAYCHLPNGLGRPENESVAGLPEAYIVEQLADFKDGQRHSSVPNMGVVTMIPVAQAATPEEVEEAAKYFASLKLTKWITVVETNTVPKSHPAGRMMVVDAGGGTEPIGERVIEVPKNLELTELRDSKSGFIAYAPVGSIKKGENLVRTGGNGETIACTTCHGQDLHGLGTIPPLAGRSPSELGRQIFDFQTGARNGPNAALMKVPVSKLTNADVVAITAYLASLEP